MSVLAVALNLNYWQANAHEAASRVLLMQPSSAAAEQVFSLLNNTLGYRQYNSLEDYIERYHSCFNIISIMITKFLCFKKDQSEYSCIMDKNLGIE